MLRNRVHVRVFRLYRSCKENSNVLSHGDYKSPEDYEQPMMVSDPCYFLHFMAFFSYLPIHSSAAPYISHRLFDREVQAFLAFLMFSAIKMVREETWEAFVADSLLYAKIFLIAVSLVMDSRVAIWFSVIFAVVYLLAQQPAFSKLGTTGSYTYAVGGFAIRWYHN